MLVYLPLYTGVLINPSFYHKFSYRWFIIKIFLLLARVYELHECMRKSHAWNVINDVEFMVVRHVSLDQIVNLFHASRTAVLYS